MNAVASGRASPVTEARSAASDWARSGQPAAWRRGAGMFALASLASIVFIAAVGQADVTRELPEPVLRLDLPGHTAEIRTLTFAPGGRRLISAGRDKKALVWRIEPTAPGPADGAPRTLTRDIGRRRVLERDLRWQLGRGTRGVIQALAAAPGKSSLVALAGSGLMGSTGEILLIDAADGSLAAVLGGGDRQGHRQAVGALAFSPDGAWCFSQDLDGQAFAWQRDRAWGGVELAAPERDRYGEVRTAALRARPATRPLAAVKGSRVALPVLVSLPGAKVEVWHLDLHDPLRPGEPQRVATDHLGVVLAMAASPDGRFLASADLAGRLFVHDLDAPAAAATVIQLAAPARALAVSPDGARVVCGAATGGKESRLEVWQVTGGQRTTALPMPDEVLAVALSDDGRTVAWSGGWSEEVSVADLATLDAAPGERPRVRRLGGVGRRVATLAFSPESPPGRVAIGFARPDGEPVFETAFDVEGLTLGAVGQPGDWAPAQGNAGTWSLARAERDTPGSESWRLAHAGRPAGTIDLDLAWQGRMPDAERTVAWLSHPGAAEPWAVAVGTDRGITIHALVDAGTAQIVRRFRGHEDAVAALAISTDGRWLASGARDGFVMLWSLVGLGGTPLFERFGVTVAAAEGGAVVREVDPAGPLAGKGVKVGDRIDRVGWRDAKNGRHEAIDAGAVVRVLTECGWSDQIAFSLSRAGKENSFNRLPAWENVAAIHVAANREWAFFTPAGYYAASANGDSLFGWHVNRGLELLPRFFPAARFRRRLERPDVMMRLLDAGSLDAALRAAARGEPEDTSEVLPRLIEAAPQVRIVAPLPGELVPGETVRLVAEIEVAEGSELEEVRAYATGVAGEAVAPDEHADSPPAPGWQRFAWNLSLPREPRHLLQVTATTGAGVSGAAEIVVAAGERAQPARRPRLHLLACGVDHYLHADRMSGSGLGDLAFAVADAEAFQQSLFDASRQLYDPGISVVLKDAEVTAAGWRTEIEKLVAAVGGEAGPDDLVVIFLAGHGLVNDGPDRTYHFLCHDALVDEQDGLLGAREGTVTWEDFRALADLGCRKVAIVDTCHSGALGPARRAALSRDFRDHMFLVVAASGENEPSQESENWGHGAFTTVLLAALGGAAERSDLEDEVDDPGETVVTFDELVDYVTAEVPRLTQAAAGERGVAAEHSAQHPTLSPEGLIPYVTLPLAGAGAVAKGSSPLGVKETGP